MDKPDQQRRKLLLALGAGGVGAAAVLAGAGKAAVAEVEEAIADEPEKTKGYQATEHVKKYYRTAKV